MQLANQQQFLVKTSKNLVYHFFLDPNKSLHYSIYTRNNTIGESTELVASIIEFSVAIDKHEKIHIIGVTKDGELVYYIHQNDKWSHKTISKLDIKSNVYRYLSLYVQGGYTHIIYNKTNLLTPMLSCIEHIYWNQSGLSKAIVGNYTHGRYPSPPQISIDSMNNLHLIYKVYYKNNHQLYYSKFNILSKKWAPGELLSSLHEDNSHPYIFIDNKDNLHLAWCIIEQNNFILRYKSKPNVTHSKLKWSTTQSLSNKNSNILSPIISQEADTLKIYCKQNNQIIEVVSTDFGHSWNYAKNPIYKIEDPQMINYCNSQEANESLYLKHIYGSIRDTIQVAGILLFDPVEDPPIPDHPKEEFTVVPTIEPTLNTKINRDIEVMEKSEVLMEKPSSFVEESAVVKENTVSQENPVVPVVKESTIVEKNIPANENTITEDPTVQNSVTEDAVKKVFPHSAGENDSNPSNEEMVSGTIIDELLTDYHVLKNKLYQIEEDKENFIKSISDCEAVLNLLEEKIIDYKKQMLMLQDKINELTNHTNIFQRFLNFFK